MMECRGCGKRYEDGISFCCECGASLVPVMAGHQADTGMEQAAQNAPVSEKETQAVSVGEWVLVLLMPLIPCVGWLVWLVMMFVWGFGENVKPSKKTFARASLIVALVALVLILVLVVIGAAVGFSISQIVEQAPHYQYRYHYYY